MKNAAGKVTTALFLAAVMFALGAAPAATPKPADNGDGDAPAAAGVSTYPTFHIAKIVKEEMLYAIGSAPFPSCHASTIVETEKGNSMAAYFGGTAERNPDVCIWVSRFVDGKWLPPEKASDGVLEKPIEYMGKTMERVATWNPALFQPKGGPIYLYYKVGPSPQTWWGEFKTSEDEGKTWSKATRLAADLIGPVKDKPVQLSDGTIVSGSSTEGSGSHVHMELSYDNGKTWKRTPDVAGTFGAIQPTVLKYALPGGGVKLQALCRTSSDFLAESWSTDEGKTWTELKASKMPNPNSGVDAVTLADGRQVLAYNPTKRADPQKGRTPLNIATSTDGINWKDVLTLDNDLAGQYSYPGIVQTRDGMIHVVYTYHRKTIKHVVIDPKSF